MGKTKTCERVDFMGYAIGTKVKAVLRPIISILFAFCVVALIVLLLNKNPINVFGTMIKGAFGTSNAWGETLLKATTLIFTGLAYAFAAKCGLVNIGIEGQLYMGALGSTIAGINIVGLPAVLHIPICLLMGFLFGGVWGGIVGFLKNQFGSSEIITTVMMNYIAKYIVGYLVTGPMMEPTGKYPQTLEVQPSARLPILIPQTRLNFGFVVALIMLVVYFVYWRYTTAGYEMAIVGRNQNVAAYAGMAVKRMVLISMCVSGGLGGLAGSMEILGIQMRLKEGFSAGYGFDGIAIALLGGNGAAGIGFSSVLFGALRSGGNRVQMVEGVPTAITSIIQALVILFVLVDFLAKRKKTATQKEAK